MAIEGQLNPAERALITRAIAEATPSSVCGWVLRHLPHKFSRSLSDGKNRP